MRYLMRSWFIVVTLLFTNQLRADAQIYGEAFLSLASLDDDNGQSIAIKSHNSRVGVKADLGAKHNMAVYIRVVWQVDFSDEANSSKDHIKAREQFVGLKGNWGKVHIGRDDSPYKLVGDSSVAAIGVIVKF